MAKDQKIKGTAEAWETGLLGRSAEHTQRASADLEQQIDDALGLQAISIRLPKATIEAYKNIAEIHGVGYQPLMRDAICRWVDSEMKMLLAGAVQSQREVAHKKTTARAKHKAKASAVEEPMRKAA